MKTAARLLVIPVLFIFCFLLFAFVIKAPVLAVEQTQPQQPTNQYLTPVTNPDVPQNMHTYTQSIFIELMGTAFCQLTGYDPISPNHKCLGIDPVTQRIGFVENGGGLIGATGNLITMTYQMPTSTSQYIGYLASNFGIAKKTYAADNPCANPSAAGAGFCSVQPLTSLWISMRNIVYLIFTIIFIVIGMAIMLRVHIDPRTVMTLENQIPKIIVGILLVTFSLAIAGLLIDIMYVAIYFIGNVLSNTVNSMAANPAGSLDDFASRYGAIAISSSPLEAKDYFNADIVGGVADAFSNVIVANIHSPIQILGTDVLQLLARGVLFIIFLLAFWISLLRVWISLIVAYIMILMDIVFAPFWFLAGLLPGGSLGVGAWFKDILANLAVFPATIAMFAMAIIFLNMSTTGPSGQLFNPPLVGGFAYGSEGNTSFTLGQLIAFGFIFMTPQALSIMKAAFKAPKINVGPVFAPAQSAGRIVGGPPKNAIGGTISEITRRRIRGEEPDPFWKKATRAVTGRH